MDRAHSAALSLPEKTTNSKADELRGAVITQVRVERLFGRYTYTIPSDDPSQGNIDRRLILLYGDNGSGKTTILRLIHHLLSSGIAQGHRTYLAQTPFSRFSVSLDNGFSLSVKKSNDDLRGSYTVEVLHHHKKRASIPFEAKLREDEYVIGRDSQTKSIAELSTWLERFALKPYLLEADRSILSDDSDQDDDLPSFILEQPELERGPYFRLARERRSSRDTRLSSELSRAILLADDWLRKQALQGTNTGSEGTNQVYLAVVRRLLPTQAPDLVAYRDNSTLEQRIIQISKRTSEFARFGLLIPLHSDEFLEVLRGAPLERLGVIQQVLIPYLDGIDARLKALGRLHDLLTTFVDHLNDFLVDKSIRFTVAEGLTIQTDGGEDLDITDLSSGEKQLLLLLCYTLVARDETRVFLIDEPEISLNVKWQRQLLRALLDCTRGTRLQFIVATHSLEMITGNRRNAVRLANER